MLGSNPTVSGADHPPPSGATPRRAVLAEGVEADSGLSTFVALRVIGLDRHEAGEIALRLAVGRPVAFGSWPVEIAEAKAQAAERAWRANGCAISCRTVPERPRRPKPEPAGP